MNSLIHFYDFTAWPKARQIAAVWKFADHIESVKDKHTSYTLYAMCGFYVELTRTYNGETILDVTTFRTGARLDKFWSKSTCRNCTRSD